MEKADRSAVYIFPKVNLSDVLLVRKAADEIRDLPITGKILNPVSESVIFSEILRMIEKDGKMIMILSFLGTILPIIIAYRNFKAIILLSAHLFFTVFFMLGAMLLFKLEFNFFNVLMLPLIFGLAIDYGEYIYSRYLQEGKGSIYFVLTHTSPAVFMSAFTTILGFATLLLAQHQGLKSIGQLSIIGIFSAFLSASVVLLSILAFVESRWKNEKT